MYFFSNFSTASNAVDGIDIPDVYSGSCTHTNSEVLPWFVVDLGDLFNVIGVAIVNREIKYSRSNISALFV